MKPIHLCSTFQKRKAVKAPRSFTNATMYTTKSINPKSLGLYALRIQHKNAMMDETEEQTSSLHVRMHRRIQKQQLQANIHCVTKPNNIQEKEEKTMEKKPLDFKKWFDSTAFMMRILNPVDACSLAVGMTYEEPFAAIRRLILKYGVLSMSLTACIAKVINREPFGFVRITFSIGASLFMRLFVFGLVIELLSYYVLAWGKKESFFTTARSQSQFIYATLIPYVIGNAIVSNGDVASIVWIVCAFGISCLFHSIAFYYESLQDVKKAMYKTIGWMGIVVFGSYICIGHFGADILRMLECLMGIHF